jgi:hypothetical protein
MDNNHDGLNNINKMYDKLTYFDQYGSSFLLLIIITIVLVLAISYCFIMANLQPIKDDWSNKRCKPYIIPFAGIINTPEGDTMVNFTANNFTYCTQNILQGITGEAVKPLTFITNTISSVVNSIKQALNLIRAMIDKVRTFFQSIAQEIMGRLSNMMIPLQEIIISVKDFIGKLQGTMTAGLFTSLGTYYTLKALLGAIAQFIIIILIALAALIAVFWVLPFTWGAAIANTAIFVAIAIPMALILTFMIDVLKVQTDLSIPSVKCFDKNTIFEMNNGEKKKAYEINVGDILKNSGLVTAKIIVETKGSQMYNLNDVIVSDSHKVYENNKLILVSEHFNAVKIKNYTEPYLYCFNTSSKKIVLNNTIFADWDDLSDTDVEKLLTTKIRDLKLKYDNDLQTDCVADEIHKYLDGGFVENTEIQLKSGVTKKIKNINIGDILEKGEKVYGVIEIYGKNLKQQTSYNLSKNITIEGGTNICFCSPNIPYLSTLDLKLNKKKNLDNDKLYHLLTDRKFFYIKGIRVYDYNACIELFLEKDNIKLLSMKYV